MIVELTENEILIVGAWYEASAGESAHDPSDELFSLLEKLGIEAVAMDLWLRSPEFGGTEANQSISSYRRRHATDANVVQMEAEQPLPVIADIKS